MIELISTVCAGLFAGAALYISLVQHPAAVEAGQATAASFFAPMYRRAAAMQAGLAVVGTLASLVLWLTGAGWNWGVGALLLGSVVPFTLIVIKPINNQLLDPSLDVSDQKIPDLLKKWGALHWVRTVASCLAFVILLCDFWPTPD